MLSEPRSHSRIVRRRTVDRRDLGTHRPQVARKLLTVMDRVEETPEEHVAERGFPGTFPVHKEPAFLSHATSSNFATRVWNSAAFFSYAAIDSGTVGTGRAT